MKETRIYGLKKKTYINVLVLLGIILIVTIIGNLYKKQENITAHYYNKAYAYEQQIKELTIQPATKKEQISAYIKKVFGKDSDKAFKLLKCENPSLDPLAVSSTNDYGIFQINEYWQKTQSKFLKNWKVNIEIAHQLYVENNNSFKLWSCNKYL